MTPSRPPNAETPAAKPAKRLDELDYATPPEEQFWEKYSPHHEFPLSGVASIVAHIGALFLAALFGGLIFGGCERTSAPPTIDTLDIGEGGYGGDVNGEDRSDGKDLDVVKADVLPPVVTPPVVTPEVKVTDPTVIDPNAVKLDKPPEVVVDLTQALEDAIAKNSKPKGDGKGEGPGGMGGNKTGFKSARGDRILRWRLKFEYSDEFDYIRQMHLLGAQVAMAQPGTMSRVRIIRDISKLPAVVEEETVAKVNKIFWREVQPDMVVRVCSALGVPPPKPLMFYAFMPLELEDEMLKRELEFGKRKKSDIKEADIEETIFLVTFVGQSHRLRVVDLTLKKGVKK